jgi:hypothetical protein
MDELKDFLRQYWANLLAFGVFCVAAVRFWLLGEWFDANHLRPIIFAFAGLIAFVASDDWTDWSGGYGLTRNQWINAPSWAIRLAGAIALVYFTVALFRM